MTKSAATDQPTATKTSVKPTKPSHAARLVSASSPRHRQAQPDTPKYLIPQMGKLPVSDAMHFVTAHLISAKGSTDAAVISGPLKLKPVAAAQLPATGVLLTHEQGWFARGLALGNLLHSITLAPGEVTQVAVVEWHRQESGSAQESTQQDDSTSATDQRNRAVDDVQQSTLKEVQKGSSFAASASVEAEGGFSLPIFSAGGGANTTTGYSTNYSDGTRDLSLSENQRINEATTRNAQASRSRRASVVRETSQAEGEQLTTRVVANYNHAHALTMMYFEVVEVFDLTTKVIDAERLIYLPMEVVDVRREHLFRFGNQFVRAAQMRGDTALADDIKEWIKSHTSEQPLAGQPLAKEPIKSLQSGNNAGGQPFADDLTGVTRIESITITHSKERIDSIQTKWLQSDRSERAGKVHGSYKEKDSEEVVITFGDDEEILHIDGRINTCPHLNTPVVISLTITTNEKSYGPYGDTETLITTNDDSGTVGRFGPIFLDGALGFFGRSGWAIDAIGLLDDAASLILSRLNHEKLFYNQVMWVAQEPGAVIESLRGLKWPSKATRSLSESIDPKPVTLTGNYVGYRWHFDNARQRNAFLKQYIDTPDESAMSHSASVAVPTGGVFGEAVLGQAVSAEKIDLTRFWKWQDSPIPILPSQISPLQAGGRARDINTSTGQLNESAAKLDQLAALPDPAGFSAASQMMTSNIFRDMSGSDVVKELALAASQHAADGADNAAQLASQNLASFMNFMKELTQMAVQKGGMDSTTLGGMQSDPEEGEGGETSGPEGVLSELTGSGEEEGGAAGLEEVAETVPFVLPV